MGLRKKLRPINDPYMEHLLKESRILDCKSRSLAQLSMRIQLSLFFAMEISSTHKILKISNYYRIEFNLETQ